MKKTGENKVFWGVCIYISEWPLSLLGFRVCLSVSTNYIVAVDFSPSAREMENRKGK